MHDADVPKPFPTWSLSKNRRGLGSGAKPQAASRLRLSGFWMGGGNDL